ncbi:MAG: DUF4336 domain-containing protein [Acidobacteriaceae bacterium]
MFDLSPFAEDIWIVDGPNVRDMGFMFTTRMTLVKLSNGSLWVDSPVSVPPETLKRITALGPVKYLVAATPRHVWRLSDWHTLFPEAQLWAARPTPFTLKKGPLPFTGFLGDGPPPEAWMDDFDQLAFKGNPLIEEVLFLHKPSRTVILDDLIQIHPEVKGKYFRNALFKLEGVLPPHGGVGLDIRLTFIHRRLARQSLQKLLSWDFDRLIIAHGPCIEKDAKPFVKHAFRWLQR